ncbi:hypothetical protein G3I76_54240, partial [Streptomyces sp. SID11233]|nr:hypothetical protein [Streptomyces sp. SID11233]
AARMRELGHSVLLYESPGGGHGGGSDNGQAAFNSALAYTFLWRRLSPPRAAGSARPDRE